MADQPAPELLTTLGRSPQYQIRLPDEGDSLAQDREWCEVRIDDRWQRIRFHDYDRIYRVPGLYESLFYRLLRCTSPRRVALMLEEVLHDEAVPISSLRALDLGAGNGMVGVALQNIGVSRLVGADILPEARDAALRDRPWIYDDYVIADFCDLPESVEHGLRKHRFNCLACVAALGFGDIPTPAFVHAVDLIDTPGWLAFNIKENFLTTREPTGFSALIRRLMEDQVIRVDSYRRYRHRFSVAGRPLHYVAMIARKVRDLPDDLLGPAGPA